MKDGINEYGTPVGVFVCEACGEEFTVCPKPTNPENDVWRTCSAIDCSSYDPNRDAEVLFMSDEEVAALPVVGIQMLRARRTGVLLVPCPPNGGSTGTSEA